MQASERRRICGLPLSTNERVEGGVNKVLLLAKAHCSCTQSCSGTMLAQLSKQRVTMKLSYAIQDTN